jgi:hypothetical protein
MLRGSLVAVTRLDQRDPVEGGVGQADEDVPALDDGAAGDGRLRRADRRDRR